jgi:ABC-2 type transport system ATP-binding protein
MKMTNEYAISIEKLVKHYGRIEALKGISLNVSQGQIFGLLGANGAGKTTLLRALVGAVRPTNGRITLLGLNPARQARQVRRLVGYMPQQPTLYEDLSARDNVRFFARAHSVPHLAQRVDEVLAFTDLTDRQHDLVHGFSGGMKQRVSLACALVHRPQLLLLDEPSAGVDPRLRETFWQHFRDLARQGTTILVSTHQLDEVLHCDQVAVMRQGLVLACDRPRHLLQQGQATITIWHNGDATCATVDDYPQALPQLLRPYHLDTAVTRIEVEPETLEAVILRLINKKTEAEDNMRRGAPRRDENS